METSDYIIAWLLYIVVAFAMSWMLWKFLKKTLWLDLAYILQAVFMAIVFTPWYVLDDQNVLAPAIIIFVMDVITIGTVAGIRSLVPMAMAILLVSISTMIVVASYRIRRVRRLLLTKKQKRTKRDH